MAKKLKQRPRPDINEHHHVARHCNHQRLDRDPTTGEVRGVFPQEFELRPWLNEEYLSLNWFEYFECELAEQYQKILATLRKKRKVHGDSAIARLNAGAIISVGIGRNLNLRLRNKSSRYNPAYAGLEGMPLDNSDSDLLVGLTQICSEIRLVSSIDA